ncbi:MAG: hypothetical protein JRG91_08490 [Deltaproteobacteria bacterium]|nr:hypothetical protein [Deltaproteobacteria bacterium]
MKVITSLAGASALCLAASSCKGGGQAVDGAGERAVTVVQADAAIAEPESSPLALVLDPDDEAFESTGRQVDAGTGGPEASLDKASGRGPEFTVKGVLRKVDPASGFIVVEQLLADGKRQDVKFHLSEETHLGWSKASKKMSLADLPPGVAIYVTYYVDSVGVGRRNSALSVVIPGGMEDVARMILAEPDTHPPKK